MMRALLKFVVAAPFMVPTVSAAHAAEPPQAYVRHCKVCHQTGGAGVSTIYPRIAGRAGVIASSEKGRAHLVSVLLNGQFGRIEVDGKSFMGVMAPYKRLKDDDLADILNYVTALPGLEGEVADVAAYTPEEIAQARSSASMSARDVYQQREALKADGLIP